jgi:chromate transporter
VVLEAVIKIGRRALKNNVMLGLAVLSFIAIFFFNIPFPIIILTAGFIGYGGGYLKLPQFSTAANAPTDAADELRNPTKPSWGRTARILAVGLTLWFTPLLLLVAMFGRESIFVRQGLFFSQMAVVTFGGAYSVLVYVAQQAVEVYGWLTPREMLDGLGMAETTPGPLIQVVQFVAFMGAYRQPGLLNPIVAGVIASMITTWVTFVPCFIWIFLGAPYIEQLRGHRALSTALAAITAAVVGVILNLAVWFSLHTMFGVVNVVYMGPIRWQIPVAATLDGAALVIALVAGIMLFYYKRGMLITLAGCALLGLAVYVVR